MKSFVLYAGLAIFIFINQNVQAQTRPDKMPVYPGCEQNEQAMSCMREKILGLIGENFNTDLLHQIKDTEQVSMQVSFTIDATGNITDIDIKSGYDSLNVEMQRVIKLLPNIKPAEAEGYPISMRYELPVVFKIEK